MTFSVPDSDLSYVAPDHVTVRIHDKTLRVGEMAGISYQTAEVNDFGPRIIFVGCEIQPVRGMLLSVEDGLGYRIDSVEPAVDITITATAVRLSRAEVAGWPIPEFEP